MRRSDQAASLVVAATTPDAPDRDVGPERQRRVAAGHDREPTSEGAVQRDEDDEAADPHRGPDEVQPHRVDRRLVVVGRAGVAGQAEHEDAGGGEGGQPGRGRSAAGQGRTARDDEGAARADQPDPGRVDLPDEVGELRTERAARQRQARRVGEGQHDPGQGCDGPDETGERREPQRRVRRRRRPARSRVDAHSPAARSPRRAGRASGMTEAAKTSAPSVTAAATSCPTRTSGTAHRTRGPGVLDEDERLHRARRPRRHGARDQAADDRDEGRRGRRQPRGAVRRRLSCRRVHEADEDRSPPPDLRDDGRRHHQPPVAPGQVSRLDVCRQLGHAATQG